MWDFFFIKSSLILNQPYALIWFQAYERSNVKDQNNLCRCENVRSVAAEVNMLSIFLCCIFVMAVEMVINS